MQPVEPIQTVELFPGLSAELLNLLKRLPRAAWDNETVCVGWSVKDLVGHLLGGNLGRLSFGRDRLVLSSANAFPSTYPEQVAYINQQNMDWVNWSRRISPNVLLDFLALTDEQLYVYFKALLPLASSGPAVSWAGDTQSPNWFDIAREYTEKWLHQQHIREAVGQPVLAERQWLFPVLDTFMRALPHTYRAISAPEGTQIWFHISGEAGGDWSLLRQAERWILLSGAAPAAVATVRLDPDTAWRSFTKGISPAVAQAKTHVTGDATLGLGILDMVSIMA